MLKEVFEEGLYEELRRKDPERLREIESWDPVLVVRDWGYIVAKITDILMFFVSLYCGYLLLKWGDIFRGYGLIIGSIIILFYSIKKAIYFRDNTPILVLLKEGNFIYYSKNYKKELPSNCYAVFSKVSFLDVLFVKPLEIIKIWKNVSQKRAPNMWFILFPMIFAILIFLAFLRTISMSICKMILFNRNNCLFFLFFFYTSSKEIFMNMDWKSLDEFGGPRIIFLDMSHKNRLIRHAKCIVIL